RSASNRGATSKRASSARRTSSDSRASDRKSTRLNSSHLGISYAVFCLKQKGLSIAPYSVPIETQRDDRGPAPWPAASSTYAPSHGASSWSTNGPSARCSFFFLNDTATTGTSPLPLRHPFPF